MALVYKTYRPMEQNGNPRNNGIYGQIIFNKGIQWRKDNLFNKYCWEYQISRAKKKKKNEVGLLLNTKDRWIKHLNFRPNAIQLLEETVE